MKRAIIEITAIILCLGFSSCIYFGYKYYTFNKIEDLNNNISVIDDKISSIDKEIEEKNRELENIKHENEEKVSILELWQNALNQVKKDS